MSVQSISVCYSGLLRNNHIFQSLRIDRDMVCSVNFK